MHNRSDHLWVPRCWVSGSTQAQTGGTAVHATCPNARSPMWNPRPSTLPLWPEFAEVARKSQLVWSPWASTLNQGMLNTLALPYSIRSDPDSSPVEDLGTPQVHWRAIRENCPNSSKMRISGPTGFNMNPKGQNRPWRMQETWFCKIHVSELQPCETLKILVET